MVLLFVLNLFIQEESRYTAYLNALENHGAKEAVELTKSSGEEPYNLGIRIMEENAQNGLLWFSSLYAETKKPDFLYGEAFSHWRLGQLFKSRWALAKLNELNNQSPILAARMHYLNGLVSYASSDYENAKNEFRASLELYSQLSKMYKGQYNCFNMLALNSLTTRDFEKAHRYMEKAQEFSAKAMKANQRPNLATAHEIKGVEFYLLGMDKVHEEKKLGAGYEHFNKAIFKFQEALAFHIARERKLADGDRLAEGKKFVSEPAQGVLVRLAILKILTGKYQESYDLASSLKKTDNPMIRAWVDVYFMKLSECSKQPAQALKFKNLATDWAMENRSQAGLEVWQMIKFLDVCGCLSSGNGN